MKKDTLVEQAIVSAEKLALHGIDGVFGFIVGFPEEGFENTLKTLSCIKEIKRINPNFQCNIFFFTPYPGTELFKFILRKGYRVPATLAEWSEIDFTSYAGYWIKDSERRHVDRFKFYSRLSRDDRHSSRITHPFRSIAAQRVSRDFYDFPVEKQVADFVRYKILRRTPW